MQKYDQDNYTNKYDLVSYKPILIWGITQEITFKSHVTDMALPNPVYLASHAAYARVLHLSGAAEYIERLTHDEADCRTLSSDGNDAIVLTFAIIRQTGIGVL